MLIGLPKIPFGRVPRTGRDELPMLDSDAVVWSLGGGTFGYAFGFDAPGLAYCPRESHEYGDQHVRHIRGILPKMLTHSGESA